jgi:hypothetical protein
MEDNSLLDHEWQNVQALKSMFDSSGWKTFEEHVLDLISFEDCYLEAVQKNAIRPEHLHDFNFHLAKRQVYKQILLLKDTLIDEIVPEEGDAISTSQDQ